MINAVADLLVDLLREIKRSFCDSDSKWCRVLKQRAFDLALFSQKYTQGRKKKLIKFGRGLSKTIVWQRPDSLICKYIVHTIDL